jgi:hypothetical protein
MSKIELLVAGAALLALGSRGTIGAARFGLVLLVERADQRFAAMIAAVPTAATKALYGLHAAASRGPLRAGNGRNTLQDL